MENGKEGGGGISLESLRVCKDFFFWERCSKGFGERCFLGIGDEIVHELCTMSKET